MRLLLEDLCGNQTFQLAADPAGEWYMTLALDPRSQPLFYLNLRTAEANPIIEPLRSAPVQLYRYILEQRWPLLEACRRVGKYLAGQADRATLEALVALAYAETPIGAASLDERETDKCLDNNPIPC